MIVTAEDARRMGIQENPAEGAVLPPASEPEFAPDAQPDFTPDAESKHDGIDKEPEELPEEILSLLAMYTKAYPKEKVFHITADKQVFLDANKWHADEHAKSLNKPLFTYQVKA